MDEFGLIQAFTSRLPKPRPNVLVGIGDDAAVIQNVPGNILVTTDTMVEGVHFLKTTLTPYLLGYKSLAVSVSDIAAMGGTPHSATVSLAIPSGWTEPELSAVYDGMAEISTTFGLDVVGGDVVSTTGPFVVTTTVIGSADKPVLRSGAKPGDVLFVTGWLGGSSAGLEVQQRDVVISPFSRAVLVDCHQRPKPRVDLGRVAAQCGVRALNDISDGLASELNEVAQSSGIRCRVEAERIPVRPEVKELARVTGTRALDYALFGGEDYELVGAAPRDAFARLLAMAGAIGVPVHAIGKCEEGDGVVLRDEGRLEVLQPKGYNHFERGL